MKGETRTKIVVTRGRCPQTSLYVPHPPGESIQEGQVEPMTNSKSNPKVNKGIGHYLP